MMSKRKYVYQSFGKDKHQRKYNIQANYLKTFLVQHVSTQTEGNSKFYE